MAGNSVLMIGLDAADCDFIEANLEHLPTMAAMAAGRPLHRLDVEPLSGAVWTTFMTERTPGHHGVYHHMQWDPQRMTLRRTHPNWIGPIVPFWRDLARAGRSVTAFDVPFVFEGDTGGAVEVANWGSHDIVGHYWSSDRSADAAVTSVARRHPMGFEVPVRKSAATLDRLHREILAGIPQKAEAACRLMAASPSDLFVVVFGESHRAGHLFWPEPNDPASPVPDGAILDVYKALDTAVARLMAAAGPETVTLLFALHGMGPNQSQSHLSAAMLETALGLRPDAESGAGFGPVRLLRRTVPAPVQLAIARSVPTAVRDFVLAREIAGGHVWAHTSAISLDGDLSGYWRANVAGREAKGIVTDLPGLLSDIAAQFTGFETDDGDRLVEAIHFPARDAPGDRAGLLPDIVAEWSPDLLAVERARHVSGARIAGQRGTGRSGNHRFHGFCAVSCGPQVGDRPPMPGHIKDLGTLARALLG